MGLGQLHNSCGPWCRTYCIYTADLLVVVLGIRLNTQAWCDIVYDCDPAAEMIFVMHVFITRFLDVFLLR